jgi:NDP-sugar pyrophosphorylase family protein
MQIVIPMSGFGERFRKAGYTIPKPLIEVEGKPIIAHVIDMFPGEKNFLFICNEDHLNNPDYRMREILDVYCPTGKILSIPSHSLGPVHAVLQAKNLIDFEEEVIINYCDFTCYWDWKHFKKFVLSNKCDGCIPAYKGFHPHSLGSTNYAYIKEDLGVVTDIQEKKPYTSNRMEEYASSGTYYFSSGKIMCNALEYVLAEELKTGSEYYVSLAYHYLFEKNMLVNVYPLQHFMQWGTPEDVNEYTIWSDIFKELQTKKDLQDILPKGSVIIPMAGLGQRFINEGYSMTKPLIPVSGDPMVIKAVNDLPNAKNYSFVLRSDTTDYDSIVKRIKKEFPNAMVKTISETTDGQASTAILGFEEIKNTIGAVPGPITVGACDSGAIYNQESFLELVNDDSIDIIVWGYRGNVNAIRKPEMFGWIDENSNIINNISVKTPLDDPNHDPIVTGTFTFKNTEIFSTCMDSLFGRDGKINGEFYLDSCINDALNLGYKCVLFEIDYYISWGTPNDLRTYEYWQSCFHKWSGHTYTLEKDENVSKDAAKFLDKNYKIFNMHVK